MKPFKVTFYHCDNDGRENVDVIVTVYADDKEEALERASGVLGDVVKATGHFPKNKVETAFEFRDYCSAMLDAYGRGCWLMKDGREITVAEMETSHLINAGRIAIGLAHNAADAAFADALGSSIAFEHDTHWLDDDEDGVFLRAEIAFRDWSCRMQAEVSERTGKANDALGLIPSGPTPFNETDAATIKTAIDELLDHEGAEGFSTTTRPKVDAALAVLARYGAR